jgi:palmitoyltransferase
MGWVLTLYLGIALVGGVVLVMGPGSEGPIGRVHRGLCGCLANSRHLLQRAVGPACCDKLEGAEEYVCFRPNPILAGLYFSIMLAFAFSIVRYLFPLVPNPRMGWVHRPLSLAIIGGGLVLHQLCCNSNPGVITRDNVGEFADGFPYDGIMYNPKFCETCRIVRPARSKHCAVCDRCVSKFDHHCPWINSCAGERNYRLFLAFLAYHVFVCAYGSLMLVTLGRHLAFEVHQLGDAYYVDSGGQHVRVSVALGVQYMMAQHPAVFSMLFFASVMGCVILAFFGALRGRHSRRPRLALCAPVPRVGSRMPLVPPCTAPADRHSPATSPARARSQGTTCTSQCTASPPTRPTSGRTCATSSGGSSAREQRRARRRLGRTGSPDRPRMARCRERAARRTR